MHLNSIKRLLVGVKNPAENPGTSLMTATSLPNGMHFFAAAIVALLFNSGKLDSSDFLNI